MKHGAVVSREVGGGCAQIAVSRGAVTQQLLSSYSMCFLVLGSGERSFAGPGRIVGTEVQPRHWKHKAALSLSMFGQLSEPS